MMFIKRHMNLSRGTFNSYSLFAALNKLSLKNLGRKLTLPKPHTNFLKHSISNRGALLRNNLPQ